MTQCIEEIEQIIGDPWQAAKCVIGTERVTLGPQASQQYLHAPEHLAMVLARYRAAAALIGDAQSVLEIGCGEGIGAEILAKGRRYYGADTDAAAIEIARQSHAGEFWVCDGTGIGLHGDPLGCATEAIVALDVIEHIPASRETALMEVARYNMPPHGVMVIGTPSASFEHLASPQSRAGHINNYSAQRLHALMSKHFKVIQSFGMQDTSLHLGHPSARHYLLMCGIGPK